MSTLHISNTSYLKNFKRILPVDADTIYFVNYQISSINDAIYGYQPTHSEITSQTISIGEYGLCADVIDLGRRVNELVHFAEKPFAYLSSWQQLSDQNDPFTVYILPLNCISVSLSELDENSIFVDGSIQQRANGDEQISIVNDCAELIYVLSDYSVSATSAFFEKDGRLSGGHWECIGTTKPKEEDYVLTDDNERLSNVVSSLVEGLSNFLSADSLTAPSFDLSISGKPADAYETAVYISSQISSLSLTGDYIERSVVAEAISSALAPSQSEDYKWLLAGDPISGYTPHTISAAIDWSRKLHKALVNLYEACANKVEPEPEPEPGPEPDPPTPQTGPITVNFFGDDKSTLCASFSGEAPLTITLDQINNLSFSDSYTYQEGVKHYVGWENFAMDEFYMLSDFPFDFSESIDLYPHFEAI